MSVKAKITRKDIKHLAWLARIGLSDKEELEMIPELNKIIEYFGKIDKINTEKIVPTYQILEVSNTVREDKPKPFPADKILKNMPNKKSRYIKAPRMT
jgi:aspartyl-tRNA(Asn)/glutamyl-tRNA(Gln) amidotransferase subunit C